MKVFELVYHGEGKQVRRKGDQLPEPPIELLIHTSGEGEWPFLTPKERRWLAWLLSKLAYRIQDSEHPP